MGKTTLGRGGLTVRQGCGMMRECILYNHWEHWIIVDAMILFDRLLVSAGVQHNVAAYGT
jgi:hypothetical protein